MKKPLNIKLCILFLMIAATGLSILALGLGTAAAQDSRLQLLITQASADLDAGTLHIQGEKFVRANNEAVVTLAGSPLVVREITQTDILAGLPSDLEPGTYLLRVSRGFGRVRNDTFALTLGAVGPEGPEGPQGPVGPKGDKGLQWRGAWNARVWYQADDAVSHEGSSWIARRANHRVPPAEGAFWTLVAAKGDRGEKGDKGDAGPPGGVTAEEFTELLDRVGLLEEQVLFGLPLWSQRFGGSGHDEGLSMAVDANGDVTVTGHFFDTVDFGGGPLTSAGSSDIFLLKLRR